MRCGIYVRVSTDDQRDNGYSIDSQLRMIKEYCEKNQYCWLSIKQYGKQDSYISRKQDINKTRFHVFKISFSVMPFQQV